MKISPWVFIVGGFIIMIVAASYFGDTTTSSTFSLQTLTNTRDCASWASLNEVNENNCYKPSTTSSWYRIVSMEATSTGGCKILRENDNYCPGAIPECDIASDCLAKTGYTVSCSSIYKCVYTPIVVPECNFAEDCESRTDQTKACVNNKCEYTNIEEPVPECILASDCDAHASYSVNCVNSKCEYTLINNAECLTPENCVTKAHGACTGIGSWTCEATECVWNCDAKKPVCGNIFGGSD